MQAYDLPRVAVISLAKREEEVFVPGRPEPIVLGRDSAGLQLLQRIRDEAHRFALGFHRQRRDAKARGSIFDDLQGVGPGAAARAAAPLRLGGAAARGLPGGARGRPRRPREDGAGDLRPAAQGRPGLGFKAVRRAALLPLTLALAASGCGGGKSAADDRAVTTTAPPVTTARPTRGKATIEAFAAAARAENTGRSGACSRPRAKARLGPTLASSGSGGRASWPEGRRVPAVPVVVSERITPEFGVVAIDGTRDGKPAVYAAALRLEGSQWKVELGGPVTVRPIGPDPDARESVVAQIAAAVQGPGGAGTAVMYLDGQVVNPEVRGTSTNSTLFANFDPALDPGRHTVVVFAERRPGRLGHRLGLHRREEGGARSP